MSFLEGRTAEEEVKHGVVLENCCRVKREFSQEKQERERLCEKILFSDMV